MLQKLKKKLKDQRGFTLIELLAVIVILGIIAAIAVPSILGLIDNSKKDAHVANAQQIISAAKMAIASETNLQSGDHYLNLKQLETKNYLDPVDSPDKNNYAKGLDTDADNASGAGASTVSHVKISNGKIVELKLITDGANSTTVRSITKVASGQPQISTKDITRSDVQ